MSVHMTRIELLHHEGGVVVVDKPAGLEATGRTREDPGGVEHHLTRQLGRRVWAVHQLDRDTTGALIFVTRRSLVARWQERLKAAEKRYLAIVHGVLTEPRSVDAAMAYDDERRRWVTREDGKPAQTRLRPMGTNGAATLVEARPTTGRTHQIRVHLASLGHPLIGERRHREPPCTEHPRHALHLQSITLTDMTFLSPAPPDLVALASRLGLPKLI